MQVFIILATRCMLVEFVKDNNYMQGIIVLALIGTEKHTLVSNST